MRGSSPQSRADSDVFTDQLELGAALVGWHPGRELAVQAERSKEQVCDKELAVQSERSKSRLVVKNWRCSLKGQRAG